jgi:hypothetical protein
LGGERPLARDTPTGHWATFQLGTISMNMSITNIVSGLGIQFPLIVVCILGLVAALGQSQRTPRVAMLVVGGVGLLLLTSLFQPIAQAIVQYVLMQTANGPFNAPRRPPNYMLVYSSLSFVFSIVRAAGVGMLIYSAFVDRPLQAFGAPGGQPFKPAS